jgi:PKD repeat protein
MRWSFPEPAGTQVEVRLYFANRYGGTTLPGQRVFDVDLEGTRVLNDFDIVVAAGGDQRAIMRSFTITSDGSVDIDFGHQVENPLVNAIEVLPAGGLPPPDSTLKRRYYDGTTADAATDGPAGGPTWSSVRGAVMVDGTLFYGRSDGKLYRRTFDGVTFGTETLIDPYNDPKWSTVDTGSGQTYRGVVPTLYGQLPAVTAFAYAEGRLYYTMVGRTGLYFRRFNPESGIVGPEENTVPGVTLPQVTGMFVSGGSFYYVQQSTGDLHRQGFAAGAPTGGDTVVSGPGSDGVDWRARALFLGPGPAPNQPPVAAVSQNCTGLTCTFSGAPASDPDGTIASYGWDFGDGGTASGLSVSHTFAATGTYPVRLTVTDNLGATGTTVVDVSVQPPPASAVSFVGVAKSNTTTSAASVQVPAGTAAGDGELLFVTVNDTTGVALSAPTGLPGGWQLVGQPMSSTMLTQLYQRVAAAGDAGGTVTVTANQTTKLSLQLAVYRGTPAGGPVSTWSAAADASSAEHLSPTVTVPEDGDWVVTFWADKSSTTTSWTAPSSVTTRDTSIGIGSGRVSWLLADSGGGVPAGPYGNLLATTNAPSGRGLTLSVVIGSG